MKFYKMHGLGNDFVFTFASTSKLANLQASSKSICDRNFGIGADGLILIVPSKVADFRMVVYNSDGSEAEMCGNAIRCASVLWAQKHPGAREPIEVETLKGIQFASIVDRTGTDWKVQVDMGEPELKPDLIPVIAPGDCVVDKVFEVGGRAFRITCVNMGNPHAVAFVDETSRELMMSAGPIIERLPDFPRKTNVEFSQVMPDGSIKVFVWERGAGPTLACGSGACAVAVAASITGRTGRKSRIDLPGGSLMIEWASNNHVLMTGPASFVFAGELTGKHLPEWGD